MKLDEFCRSLHNQLLLMHGSTIPQLQLERMMQLLRDHPLMFKEFMRHVHSSKKQKKKEILI